MAEFNPVLQSNIQPEQGVAEESTLSSTVGVANTLLSGATSVLDAKKKQEYNDFLMERQRRQDAASAQEMLSTLSANEFASELAEGYNARSEDPTKQAQWLAKTRRELRGRVDANQMSAIAKQFEDFTGERLYIDAQDLAEDVNQQEKLQLEVQQRQTEALTYAFRYRTEDPKAQEMFTPTGDLKEGFTVQQALAVGNAIKARRAAQLTVLQEEASLATSQEQRLTANQKLLEAEVRPELTADITDVVERIKGMPQGEALVELDQAYNGVLLQLNTANITDAGRSAMKTSLETTYNYVKDTLTGRADVRRTSELQGVEAAKIFQTSFTSSPAVRATMALKEGGLPISESGSYAAQNAVTDVIRKQLTSNPNDTAEDNEGNTKTKTIDGREVTYQRIVTDDFLWAVTPNRPVQTPEQEAAMTKFLSVGLNPVTAEQKANYYGRDGIYLGLLRKWSDPKFLNNHSAAVLNNEDIKGGFIRSNNDALVGFLSRTMSSRAGKDGVVADYVVWGKSKEGYPVLSVRGITSPAVSFVPGSQANVNLALEEAKGRVNELNRLFKLQYEVAYNYGQAAGDDTLVSETINAQGSALAQYIQEQGGSGIGTLRELQ